MSGRGGLANASPVRDERIANVEQRDPQSGDAQGSVAYYLDYGELSKNMKISLKKSMNFLRKNRVIQLWEILLRLS